MELISPAGNIEKLAVAYRYGADAAYLGIPGFSLRAHAEAGELTTHEDLESLADQLSNLKSGGKRLYVALNIFAQRADLAALPEVLERLACLPIEALIIADIGLIDLLTNTLPGVELHLSTQANCTNAAAAKRYYQMGFSRIVPARELSLDEVKAIKDAVPELGLEVFVHGAMCMAYSGRCFMSSALADRSANQGDCAQSCRWNYRLVEHLLEEEKRLGETIVLEADGRFTTILSARDLNLFDHIPALVEAGVDAVKIEGRMKSSYYVAAVTRSYRAAINATTSELANSPYDEQTLADHRAELFRISHRQYSCGFLLADRSVHIPSTQNEPQQYRLMGIVGQPADLSPLSRGISAWQVKVKNTIHVGRPLEFLPPQPIGPVYFEDRDYELRDLEGQPTQRITDATHGILITRLPLEPGMVIRAAE